MDRLEIISFFDKNAKNWDKNECPRVFVILQEIINKIEIKAGDSVLDIGCGTGILRPYIKSCNAGEILHVDISKGMLKRLKTKYPSANTMSADFETVNLPSETFDKIIAYNVFPHFIDKQAVFDNAFKFLKHGGTFFIAHSMTRERLNKVHGRNKETKKDLLPSQKEMLSLYEKAGFKDISVEEESPGFFASGKKKYGMS
jgi:demethylmenaquinone methyltransferase/2-methoxy-6-polyprenyl-1,4-benzoquinol methylase